VRLCEIFYCPQDHLCTSYVVPPLQFCAVLRKALYSYRSSFLLELRRTASWTSCLCFQNKHFHLLSIALPILLSASFNLPPNFSISTLEFLKFASLFVYFVHHSWVPSVFIAIKCVLFYINSPRLTYYSGSLWPRGLKCWSAAVRLLGLRVRIPPRS